MNRGWVTLCPNLGVFPLEQTRHVGVAKSVHPRLTNGEINFEQFQLVWSQSTNVTDRQIDRHCQTDRQTDRQTTCDRNTALCTKVHRAVKTTGLDNYGGTGTSDVKTADTAVAAAATMYCRVHYWWISVDRCSDKIKAVVVVWSQFTVRSILSLYTTRTEKPNYRWRHVRCSHTRCNISA